MTIKEMQKQLDLLEQNNSLLRLLQETETNQDVRVLIANQIFNNQIQIGYFSCIIVIEQGFGAIENKIDEISSK
jgi:transcriptional regulator of heat shock response